MRKLSLLIIVLFIFSSVSATDSDVVFRLASSTEGTHAGLWNQTSYTHEVTWASADSHECTGDNTVLRLHREVNAHVAAPWYTSYTYEACFGDLSCTVREGSCDVGETCLGSMNAEYNAHFAMDCGYYGYDLCCVDGCVNIDMLCPALIWDEINQEAVDLTSCVEDGTSNCCGVGECIFDGECYGTFENESIDGVNNWWCTEEHWCPITDTVAYVYNEEWDMCEPIQEACYEPEDPYDPVSLEQCNYVYPESDWWSDLTGSKPCIDFTTDPDKSCCIQSVIEGIDFFFYQDIEPDLYDADNDYIDGVTVCGDYYACGDNTDEVCPSEYADCKGCILDDTDCCGVCDTVCDGYVCGDGIISPSLDETCDSDLPPGLTDCSSVNPDWEGDLSCYPEGHAYECKLDTTGCTDTTDPSNPSIPPNNDKVCEDPDTQGQTCVSLGFDAGTLECHISGDDLEDFFDVTGCIGEDTCGNDPGEVYQEEYDSEGDIAGTGDEEDCYGTEDTLGCNEQIIDDNPSGSCITDSTNCVDDYNAYESVTILGTCVVGHNCNDADDANGDFEICDNGKWHDPDESETYCDYHGYTWTTCTTDCGTDDFDGDTTNGYCVEDDGVTIIGTVIGELIDQETPGVITDRDVEVELKNPDLTTMYGPIIADSGDGIFSIDALAGQYFLVINAEGYMSHLENITVSIPEDIGVFELYLSSECQPDCTRNDNICYSECDGINGCNYGEYYDEDGEHVRDLCHLQHVYYPWELNESSEYICCQGPVREILPQPELAVTPGGEIVDRISLGRIIKGPGGETWTMYITVQSRK